MAENRPGSDAPIDREPAENAAPGKTVISLDSDNDDENNCDEVDP